MHTSRLLFALLLISLWSCEADRTSTAETQADPDIQLFKRLSPAKTKVTFNTGGQLLYPGDATGLYSNISGMAVGDINNDGLPDLFFSGGRANSTLYLNQGGFTFKDITASAGIEDAGKNKADNQGVNFVDVNGDGWLDIYILKTGIKGNFKQQKFTKEGANLLYVNQQDNTFKEQAEQYGLDIIGLSHTANFFDYDADGDLDLYMVQTGEPGATFSFSYYEAPPRSRWLSDLLLENRNGKFVDVTKEAGLPSRRSIGLSVSVGDVNNDGYPDIYVANDFFGRDYFYLNNGDKTFTDALTEYFTKTPMSAMGSDFADINNDGWLDLFVGEMMPATQRRQKTNLVPFSIEIYNKLAAQGNPQYTRNMLQLNDGGERFRDIGLLANVYATEWSWSSFFLDADNDGNKDLMVTNGILRDMTNMDFVKDNFGDDYTAMADPGARSKANPRKAPSVATANYIFRNRNGYEFEDKSEIWGMEQVAHTRGGTYADLDADGDLDIILNNINDNPSIYQNMAEELPSHNYLRLRLKGKGQNTYGIGARVDLFYQGQQQTAYLSSQRGFQSCPEPVLHFGLRGTGKVDTLLVTWPGGQQEAWLGVTANELMTLSQGEGQAISLPAPPPTLLEEDASPASFTHSEKPFQDFRRERLLIRKYSQEGPGIAVADVNQDLRDDFFIGGASGQPGELFLQQGDGSWESAPNQPWAQHAMTENTGAVFFDANGDNYPDLYLGSGSNEFMTDAPAQKDRLYLNNESGGFQESQIPLPLSPGFTLVVTAADYDQDGDEDLFIGRRMTPGNYSEIPASALLLNDGDGGFKDATVELAPELQRAGRVTAAIWTDADNDGDLDLAVCGEWMPLTIYYQEGGKLQPKAVSGSEGWWNSLIGADLDNDGDTDYIAGNHGRNSVFKASEDKPVSLVTKDFDGNGKIDPLVFKYTDGVNAPFVNRDIFTSQMPAYNNEFYSFKKYADATFNSLVGEETLEEDQLSEAYQLRSAAFINEGDGTFTCKLLPIEAQAAPVFGLLAEDFDTDGLTDLLLTGNFYGNHYEYGSIDALGGLLLKGKGDGTFAAVEERKSGFDIQKAGRSLAIIGRQPDDQPWVLAANNDGPLQLFKWKGKVEVSGFPIGATHAILALKNGKQRRVEFYKGGGYLSQSTTELWTDEQVESVTFYQGQKVLD